jgi:hypothetical protein
MLDLIKTTPYSQTIGQGVGFLSLAKKAGTVSLKTYAGGLSAPFL